MVVAKSQDQLLLQHIAGGRAALGQRQKRLGGCLGGRRGWEESETGGTSKNGACKGVPSENQPVHPENPILKNKEGGREADGEEPSSGLRI